MEICVSRESADRGPRGSRRRPAVSHIERTAFPLVGAFGALMAAAGVALAAFAAHAGEPAAQTRLYTAAAFAFGHGAALAALALDAARFWTRVALCGLAIGTVLFAGSLVGAALFHTSTALAPAGGLVLIGSWLLVAIDRMRG